MGDSHSPTMRTAAGVILVACIVIPTLAIKFPEEKVKLGRAKCTCDFTILPEEPCTGKAKCDKKCSGKGTVALDGFEIDVKCSKGKCAVSNCKGSEPPVGSQAPTGSGSGPELLPTTGSGPEPLPTTGSGSGPVPLPIIGSGSGPVPLPNAGEGMPCSCKCSCPDGGSDCECACNCPVTSQHISCGTGFTKVCPMMKDMMCPDMMVAVCPISMMQTRAVQNRMSHEGEGRCQCVPDFLLAMVPGMPEPGTVAAGRSGRAPVKANIQFGKVKCKCTVDCKCAKGSCAKSKITCDKKCSGTAKAVEVKGCGVMDAKATKGKVKISKCACGDEPTTGTGSGSEPPVEPLPVTGSGSGPEPLPPTGSGSEPPAEPISGPQCACVGV